MENSNAATGNLDGLKQWFQENQNPYWDLYEVARIGNADGSHDRVHLIGNTPATGTPLLEESLDVLIQVVIGRPLNVGVVEIELIIKEGKGAVFQLMPEPREKYDPTRNILEGFQEGMKFFAKNIELVEVLSQAWSGERWVKFETSANGTDYYIKSEEVKAIEFFAHYAYLNPRDSSVQITVESARAYLNRKKDFVNSIKEMVAKQQQQQPPSTEEE